MIYCFDGKPGAGKTMAAMIKLLAALKNGRTVYTNIEGLDDPVCREFIKNKVRKVKVSEKEEIDFDDYELKERLIFKDNKEIAFFYQYVKRNSVIIIDEAHKYLNTRDYRDTNNRAICDWAKEHRHLGCDLLLMTIDIAELDTQLKATVQWTYRHRKFDFMGNLKKNSYLVYPFYGSDTKRAISRPETKTYDRSVFPCYKSHVGKDIKELGLMSNFNILHHPLIYFTLILICVFIYFFSKSTFAKGQLIPIPKQQIADVKSAFTITANEQKQIKQKIFIKRVKKDVVADRAGLKFVVVGKVDYGKETIFLYKAADNEDDEARAKKISSFDLDEVCRCRSSAAVNVGYSFTL